MSSTDTTDNGEDAPDPEDAPEITDRPGPWDEVVNRAILLAPWVALVVALVWLVAYGDFATDITVAGEVSATPLVYGAAALVALTYLLALMKFYGTSPIAWVANVARDYGSWDG